MHEKLPRERETPQSHKWICFKHEHILPILCISTNRAVIMKPRDRSVIEREHGIVRVGSKSTHYGSVLLGNIISTGSLNTVEMSSNGTKTFFHSNWSLSRQHERFYDSLKRSFHIYKGVEYRKRTHALRQHFNFESCRFTHSITQS